MSNKANSKTTVKVGVGMPAWLLLNQFGRLVFDAFGEWPYLVGSAAQGKQWRDVDVRLILQDNEYERMFGKASRAAELNHKWVALCLAFATLGQKMTGLPIDFQIQDQTKANMLYDGPRIALILCADFEPSKPIEKKENSETDK